MCHRSIVIQRHLASRSSCLRASVRKRYVLQFVPLHGFIAVLSVTCLSVFLKSTTFPCRKAKSQIWKVELLVSLWFQVGGRKSQSKRKPQSLWPKRSLKERSKLVSQQPQTQLYPEQQKQLKNTSENYLLSVHQRISITEHLISVGILHRQSDHY